MSDLLRRLVGDGRGIELVSSVNGIPKGSRLAVSTSLLAGLISVCMRATGQTASLEGPLAEPERRLVAARAILGEWLAGSGGGWQDSGGVWPGIKLITGQVAEEGDPEWGISRGRLLPAHRILGEQEAPAKARERLQESIVLVHGGMAQNVGPVLEMVTEKYLLRSEPEWEARKETLGILDVMLHSLRRGDIARIGAQTGRNFEGPSRRSSRRPAISIPKRSSKRCGRALATRFWGFWMLGGMSGGGMGFFFVPSAKPRRRMPFSISCAVPGVDWKRAAVCHGPRGLRLRNQRSRDERPAAHPGVRSSSTGILYADRPRPSAPGFARGSGKPAFELDEFGEACRTRPELSGAVGALFDRLLHRDLAGSGQEASLSEHLAGNGFDAVYHEQIRQDLKSGRIGLAQNRLPVSIEISDARPETFSRRWTASPPKCSREAGRRWLKAKLLW